MRLRRLAFGVAVLVAAACVEQVAAPGRCPQYCPRGQIRIADTLLVTNLARDSAFRGYVLPNGASVMLAANLPRIVDGRPIFRFTGIGPRLAIRSGDTTTGAILSADSARLTLLMTRRDTGTHNLTVALYRLPLAIDSTTTFAALSAAFTDSLVHTVNIDTLLARPGKKDSLTGDSAVVDTTNHRLALSLKLTPPAVRYVPSDSGKVAYGIRIAANTPATVTLGKGTLGPTLQWYLRVDSLGTTVGRRPLTPLSTTFASFVFDPPAPAIDSTLAVGGVPSARSMLRVAIPRAIRDSAQVIRGTLILIPAVAARGAVADSFLLEAHTVLADFGAKSPIFAADSDTTRIHIGATDTVRIEVTNLLQFWMADSTRPATIVLSAQPEGGTFTEIRFYPSSAAPYRPALHVTYLPRFPFGTP